MKNKFLIFGFILLFTSFISAEDFGYNYLEGDLDIATAINYTTISVNDSLLWDGNAWSDTRWLNIDGSNANQNIDISSYDFTTTGDITASNFIGNLEGNTSIWSRAGTNTFLTNSGDSVGIGTTSPTYKLDVQGTADTDAINSQIGYNIDTVTEPIAPTFSYSAGGSVDDGTHYYVVTYTTAIGETSAINYAQATVSGLNTVTVTIPVSTDPRVTGRKIYRCKVGRPIYEEYLLATISNNVDTQYIDTTADADLTGLPGSVYFKSDTTSNFITLDDVPLIKADIKVTNFGYGAGQSMTTGGRNVFIGSGSGDEATTTTDSVTLGYYAGSGVMTGGQNVLMGAYTGRLINSGNSNTGLGSYSLFSATTATGNTAVGRSSLFSTISGGYNVGLGYNAGQYTTGAGSIFIGYNAGNDATSGNYNILIGYDVQKPAITDSYKLNIGDTIYGDLSTDKIGINTTTPQNTLNVIGDINATGNSYIGESLNVSGNANFLNDVHIEGTLSGGSPLEILDGVQFLDTNLNKTFALYIGNQSTISNVSEIFDSTTIFELEKSENPYNMEIAFWNKKTQEISLVLDSGATGNGRASTFQGSLIIVDRELDENFTLCSKTFNYIDCNSTATNPDLGIEGDIENLGNIYVGENLNVSGSFSTSGNLTIGDKITFRLGEIIDNIVDGWIRITGNLNVVGDINQSGNFTGNQIYGYAKLYNLTGVVIDIVSVGVFENITGINNGSELNGMSYDGDHAFTIIYPGVYEVSASISFAGATSTQYNFDIFVNGERQYIFSRRQITSPNAEGSVSIGPYAISLNEGDVVTLAISDGAIPIDPTIIGAQFGLLRVGN